LVDAALSVLSDRKPTYIFDAVDMSQSIQNKGLLFERNLLATVTYEDGVRFTVKQAKFRRNLPSCVRTAVGVLRSSTWVHSPK